MIKKNKKSKTARPIHNHDTSQSPPVNIQKVRQKKKEKKKKKKKLSVFLLFFVFFIVICMNHNSSNCPNYVLATYPIDYLFHLPIMVDLALFHLYHHHFLYPNLPCT